MSFYSFLSAMFIQLLYGALTGDLFSHGHQGSFLLFFFHLMTRDFFFLLWNLVYIFILIKIFWLLWSPNFLPYPFLFSSLFCFIFFYCHLPTTVKITLNYELKIILKVVSELTKFLPFPGHIQCLLISHL